MIDARRLDLDPDQVVVGLGHEVRDRDGGLLGHVDRLLVADDRVSGVVVDPVDEDVWPRAVPVAALVAAPADPATAPHQLELDAEGWPDAFEQVEHVRGRKGEDVPRPPVLHGHLERFMALALPPGFSALDSLALVVEDVPDDTVTVRAGDRVEADHVEIGEVVGLVVHTMTGEVSDVLATHRRWLGERVARVPADRLRGVHPGHVTVDVDPRGLDEFDLVDV